MTTTTGERTQTMTRERPLVSPVLVTMLGLCLLSAVQLVRTQSLTFQVVDTVILLGALAAWLAFGIVGVGLVVVLQRYARRPGWTIWLALAWGGLAAAYFAGIGNSALDAYFQQQGAEDMGVWLSGPVVEESIKTVGIIGLMLVPVLRRVSVLDGLFYGVLVGAGFQVVEDFLYTAHAVFEAPDEGWTAVGNMLLLRGFIGVLGHFVWSGFIGAGVGLAFSSGRSGSSHRAARVLGGVGIFVAMCLLHGLDDWAATNGNVALTLVPNVVAFIALLATVVALQRTEARQLARAAADTSGWGVLTPSQVATAQDRGPASRREQRRILRACYAADRHGPDSARTQKAIAKASGRNAHRNPG